MGYSFRDNNIRQYWPDDDDKNMYLSTGGNLQQIIEEIQQKWPGEPLTNFCISAEYIHTDCIEYDLFDSMDWTNFIHIERLS